MNPRTDDIERSTTRRSQQRKGLLGSATLVSSLALVLMTGAVAGVAAEPQSVGQHSDSGRSASVGDTWAAPDGGTVDRPFSAAFNRRIPADPELDSKSAQIVDYLGAEAAYANLYDYGTPIYSANAGTPRVQVGCTKSWGPCDLEQQLVPIPDGAKPNAGSDAAMVVVDRKSGDVFEFWQATPGGNGPWRTSWGEIVSVASRGGYGSTGSGISRLAGVIRTDEIASGAIPHALVFATDNACRVGFRAPATKSDGASDRSDCIKEGARVQLNPDVDLSSLALSDAERSVAVALQRYGAYVIDNAGARMAVMFELPTDGDDPYKAAGLRWDYYAMDAIPWQRLRVLRSWNGS